MGRPETVALAVPSNSLPQATPKKGETLSEGL
jgi:hypothetical protein